MSEVKKQMWLPVIQDNLYASKELLSQIATNDDVYVSQPQGMSWTVNIPQAGAVSGVTINPESYPLPIEVRQDDILSYTLDNIVVKPIHLVKYQTDFLTYDAMASILRDHSGRLGEAQLYKSLINWYIGKQTGKHVLTTGSTTETSAAAGSTAAAKVLTVKDFKDALKILDYQEIPDDGNRIAALTTQMFYQLLADLEAGNYNFTLVEKDGLVMLEKPLYNTKIVKFNRVVNTTNLGVARPYGHAGATTDIQASLIYHKDMVSWAEGGNLNVFVNEGDATMQGDVVSANAYLGAKYRRKDLKGVVPILQDV